jgi:hypothetical protein
MQGGWFDGQAGVIAGEGKGSTAPAAATEAGMTALGDRVEQTAWSWCAASQHAHAG